MGGPSQNANEQSQNVQSAQINESQQFQLQDKANEPYTHSQPPVADFTEAQQREQVQPQGQNPAPKASHSQPHNSDITQAQLSQSQSTGNAIDRARDLSPKKGGVISRITQVFRGNFSHEEKASSKPKHLRKRPSHGKRSENGGRDQKKLLPDPPTSHSTQSRADYPQPRPRTSQGQSEGQLTAQGSSQQTQVTPHRESGPSRIEAGDDHGSKRAIVSTSDEDVENHTWERHLLQSADDATIQNKVLTLFEFIDHHVDDYYCDSRVKISQAIADQLTKVQSPHLPSEASLEDLLELARYPAPIIKHCLINLVVSGMSFQESALFPLLPDEFTVLPRAIYKETVDPCKQLYRDQAFSKLRSICAFLHPSAQRDPEYISKLDETIGRAVKLYSDAFAPWEARDSPPHKRHEHLGSLFHNAARVGVLLFSQPSTFIFDWTPSQKADSALAIQVWPRLLRTTNHNAEPLPGPQVIVEGSAQPIGVEMTASHPFLRDSEGYPGLRARGPTDVYDAYGMNQQDAYISRSPPSHELSGPSELPAPQGFVSATIQGPHNPSYHHSAPTRTEQQDQHPDYHEVQDPQNTLYACSTQKQSEQHNQDSEYHSVHSMTEAAQHIASNQDTYMATTQSRQSPPTRKPVHNAQTDFKNGVVS